MKNVVITGCSSGLGRTTARYLKDNGWTVYATARSEQHVAELRAEGFPSVELDVASSKSIDKAIEQIRKETDDRITALVNNAGYTLIGALEDVSRDAVRQQFETNVFGAVELSGRLVPLMRRQGHGRIVFISSVNGRFTFPLLGAYCASKHAIESFGDALRRELHNDPISVTVIEPGVFRTRSLENAREVLERSGIPHSSGHAERYLRLLEYLDRCRSSLEESDGIKVAKAVRKALESRRPRTRVIVPPASLVYEIMHRLLPDRLQDSLLGWRMRFFYESQGTAKREAER